MRGGKGRGGEGGRERGEEGKGREGGKGRKGERDLAPQKKNPGAATARYYFYLFETNMETTMETKVKK